MSAQLRKACLALLAGFLIWLGLSPKVAHIFYEMVLMPRFRDAHAVSTAPDKIRVQEILFESQQKHTLKGIFYANQQSTKLVVYFGGRRSNFARNSRRAGALLKTGASVFIFEYRGFGSTPGRASSDSIVADGIAAYDAALTLGFSPDNIILYGESLGVAVASYVGAHQPAASMILQSGFGSLEVQIKDMIPVLRMYPKFMFPKGELSAVGNITGAHPPLLILHGDRDRIVRKKHASWLAAAAGDNTTLVILPGADHTEVYERQDWLDAVKSFLA